MFSRASVKYSVGGGGSASGLGRVHPSGQTPPEMATVADGMHPTGMHSYYRVPTFLSHQIP